MGTENGDVHCREAGECSGTVQGSTVLRCGRASATMPVALVSTAWDSHCHTACPKKIGEASTAFHYAAYKPRKAKYLKTVMFPVPSLNFQKSDVKMNCANIVLPRCEAIYYKGRMV